MDKPLFFSVIIIFTLTTTLNIALFGHYFESEGYGFEVWSEDYYFDEDKMQIVYNFTIHNLYEYDIFYSYNLFFYNGLYEIDYYIDFVTVGAQSQLTISIEFALSSIPTYFNFNLDDGLVSVNQKINL